MAIEAIEAHVAATPGAQATDRLRRAFHEASRRLAEAMSADSSLRGMATTAAAVLISPEGPAVAHVGDSRVYRWRDGRLEPLTQDHSWVGEQVRAGVLSDDDARRHPWRNVVTRAIGGAAEPAADASPLDIAAGDRLLLCSDGLSSVVPHDRLEMIFDRRRPLQDTCDALIDAANDAGGPDNITAVLVEIDVA
jgi:protein phosphatase